MDKIRIITDSGSDIIDSKRDNVTVLPMSITFGDEVFYDGVTLSHSEFYMKLIESDELPKTSLIAPASFADAFEEAKKNTDSPTIIEILIDFKDVVLPMVQGGKALDNMLLETNY